MRIKAPSVTHFLNAAVLHWTPEKAIWIAGHSLSWDARCAGIYIGFGLGLIVHLAVEPRANRLSTMPAVLLLAGLFAPLFIDVATIHWGLRAASNDWRLLTGSWFGIAASAFLYPAVVVSASIPGANRAALSSVGGFFALSALGAAPAIVMRGDSLPVFYSLEALAVIGNVALFAIAGCGPFLLLRNLGKFYRGRDIQGVRPRGADR